MQAISKSLCFCGVYMIINIVNKHRYIGSSVNIRQRLQVHRSLLRHNHHENQHLQNAWNKYGENNFIFTVLDKCDKEERFDKEQYYVNTLIPEYNICVECVSLPPVSLESRKKMSKTVRKKINSGEFKLTHNKHVFVYDSKGDFIREYESIRKAANALNINESTITRVLNKSCIQGKGYKFFYSKQENVHPFSKPTNSGKVDLRKKYILKDDDGNTLEFLGIKEIANYFNTTVKSVRQYTTGKHKFKNKYMIFGNCRFIE